MPIRADGTPHRGAVKGDDAARLKGARAVHFDDEDGPPVRRQIGVVRHGAVVFGEVTARSSALASVAVTIPIWPGVPLNSENITCRGSSHTSPVAFGSIRDGSPPMTGTVNVSHEFTAPVRLSSGSATCEPSGLKTGANLLFPFVVSRTASPEGSAFA